MSKLDEKLPSFAQFNVLVPKWHLAYFVPIDGHFGQFVRYELQICFSHHLHFDIQTKFEVNQTKIGHYILQNTPKTHQSVIHQKAYSSYIFL